VKTRTLALLGSLVLGVALPASAQDGLKLPARGTDPASGGSGIDPSLAGGWLSPRHERFLAAPGNWRDTFGFTPTHGIQWSYPFGAHSLGMSIASGRDYVAAPIFGIESRQYGLFGRYAFDQDWSLNAGAYSREAGAVLRLQDLRIGLQRNF
jgi:hypothetical protein